MKEIKKISLPIGKIEEPTPRNPAKKWIFSSIITIIFLVIIGFLAYHSLNTIILNYMDVETEKKIFGQVLDNKNSHRLAVENFATIKNHPTGQKLITDLDHVMVSDDDIENAYASLGGHITITKKLLQNAKTEEEILFILGHERAHIYNRDVISGLAKSIPITLVTEILGWNKNLLNPEQLILSKISREAEEKADIGGKKLLLDLGLNTACADRFFKNHASNFEKYTEFIASHPDTNLRLENLLKDNPNPEKSCTEFDYQDFLEDISEK